MSRDEAKKLLEAWDFFDQNPSAKSFEGVKRSTFYELVSIISAKDDLLAARSYIEGIAAGEINETVPLEITEKVRRGEISPKKEVDTQRVIAQTRNWINSIKAKGPEQLPQKQVAAATVEAAVNKTVQEPLTEIPKNKPSPPKETAFPTKAESDVAVKPEVAVSEPPSQPAPIQTFYLATSYEKSGALNNLPAKIAKGPMDSLVRWSIPEMSKSGPQGLSQSSVLLLISKGVTSEKINEMAEAESTPKELQSSLRNLAKKLSAMEKTFSAWSRRSSLSSPVQQMMITLRNPQISQGQAVFRMNSTSGGAVYIPRDNLIGSLTSSFGDWAGNKLFGKASGWALNKLGMGTVAAEAAAGAGAVETAGAAIAGKTAGTGLGAMIGGALGLSGGPLAIITAVIGAIVAWVVNTLLPKVINWFKKNKDILIPLGLVPAAAGIIFGSAPLLITGASVMGLGWGLGGLKAGLSRMGNFLRFGLGGFLVTSIGIPFVVALITFPVVVVIILFIINSGAYLVPPSDSFSLDRFLGAENPDIGVEKRVNLAGSVGNDKLPLTVEYSIIITAKKGTLADIQISDECKVFKNGTIPTCPTSPTPGTIEEVTPSAPYTFNYTQTYSGDGFKDSLIMNTVKVKAVSPEKKSVSTNAGSSVIVGKPPTGDFNLRNFPPELAANLMAAVADLSSSNSTFMAIVNALGKIKLSYSASCPISGYNCWGYNAGGGNIILAAAGLTTIENAKYILVHELGHSIGGSKDPAISGIFQQYVDSEASREGAICSYSATSDPDEAFAEMIALTVSGKNFGCFGGSFQGYHPKQWQFANDHFLK